MFAYFFLGFLTCLSLVLVGVLAYTNRTKLGEYVDARADEAGYDKPEEPFNMTHFPTQR